MMQQEGTTAPIELPSGELPLLTPMSEVAGRLAAAEAGRDEVVRALAAVQPLEPDRDRHERLGAIGRAQLVLWKDHRRKLVAEAVTAEQKEVDDIRFNLEYELSQTLADKKERENKLIEGS